MTSPHRGSCPWPLTLAPFHLSGQVNQPFLSMSHFALQLALRGPAGPMGLTGRPGPMVSHLGVWGWVPPAGPCPSGSQLTGSEHLVVVGGGCALGTRGLGCPRSREALALTLTTTLPDQPGGSQAHPPGAPRLTPRGSQPHHPGAPSLTSPGAPSLTTPGAPSLTTPGAPSLFLLRLFTVQTTIYVQTSSA